MDGGSPVQTTGPTVLSTAFAAQLTPGTHTIGLIVTDDSGNQSTQVTRSIQVTSAAGSIQLAVDTAPDSGTTITLAGPPALGATQLDGSPTTALPASKSFTGLTAGSYVVVQSPAAGLALVRITCTDPDGGSIVSVATRTATIDLDSGESIACTFTSVVTTNAPVAGRRAPVARIHAGAGDSDPEGDRVHGRAGRPCADDGLRRVDDGRRPAS